jgi:hypothetical protein
MHPTVKPTALVIDAIKDCLRRGDIVRCGARADMFQRDAGLSFAAFALDLEPVVLAVEALRDRRGTAGRPAGPNLGGGDAVVQLGSRAGIVD